MYSLFLPVPVPADAGDTGDKSPFNEDMAKEDGEYSMERPDGYAGVQLLSERNSGVESAMTVLGGGCSNAEVTLMAGDGMVTERIGRLVGVACADRAGTSEGDSA